MLWGVSWKILGVVVLIVVGGVFFGAGTMKAPDKVLEDILVFNEGRAVVIQVKFAIPVRYENHFPEREGDLLQIKVRPVTLGGTNGHEYLGRNALLRGFAEQVPLTDVAYEADVPGGPFLTLRFSQVVPFGVSEDVANKSILISLPKASL